MPYPEEKMINDFIKKQKLDGVDESKIYKDAFEFVNTITNSYFSDKIQLYNKQVSEGINHLSLEDQWANLKNIADHAMEECLRAFKCSNINNNILKSVKGILNCKNDVLKMSKKELQDICKPEFLEKYGIEK